MWLSVAAAVAQEAEATQEAPLVSSWFHSPPLFYDDVDGEIPGFGAELTRLLAEELALPLEFQKFESIPESIAAHAAGQTDVVVGIPVGRVDAQSALASIPVATSRLRLIARADRHDEIDLDAAEQPRIGYVAGAERQVRNLPADQTNLVPVASVAEGMIALLSGDIDLMFAAEEGATGWSYRAGIDHLFIPYGQPYEEASRVVSLHRSRAELLAPIDAAIRRLEASGALPALRRKYYLNAYERAPDVLAVGIVDYPPYQTIDADGQAQGFGADVLRDLAGLAGVEVAFTPVTRDEIRQGPEAAGIDAVPLLPITRGSQQQWDFTQPLEEIPIRIFIRDEDAAKITGLPDLAGHSLAAVPVDGLEERINGIARRDVISVVTPNEALALLMEGKVDAALTSSFRLDRDFRQEIEAQGIVMLEPLVMVIHRAVALRFGMGDVREKLNAVIPAYLLSQRFQDLREVHFGVPEFWTETRIRIALGLAVGMGALVLLATVIAVMSLRARRQAEAQAAQTLGMSNRLSAITDAARNGIVGLDPAGDIAFANPSARRLLGIGAQETPFEWPDNISFFDPETAEKIEAGRTPVDQVINGETLDGELTGMGDAQGGKMRHIRLASAPVAAGLTPEIASVLILDDVTQALRHREQAERAGRMGAIGQLTGGVAHDFNNLLAVIMGNLELIKEEKAPDEIAHLADAAIDATKRGADLTRNMLAFARKSKLSPVSLDLNDVVRSSKNWIGRALPETISVETSLLAGLWPVSLDRSSLESALLNLILNARDAMDARGKLTLETANVRIDEAYIDDRNAELTPGRYVMLAVSDTGHGISAPVLSDIFEPFFTTKATGQGTGLGLSMVMGFVQQSGGTVQVYSEPNQGTSFKLYFPTTQAVSNPGEAPPSALVKESFNGMHVLLAEDEDAVRDVLIRTLKKFGCKVTAAASGDAAFEIFARGEAFDVLVTDIVMPGSLQGTDLAKALRGLRDDLPVIFMSGYANEAKVHGNGLRPEDIRLMKPVQQVELMAALAKAKAARKVRQGGF